MKRKAFFLVLVMLFLSHSESLLHAELLAMLNYESKPEQTVRKEGLAIIDVDPKSPTFGKMLMEIGRASCRERV